MSELPSVALLGFALAASPGPVNAIAFARGLRRGPAEALLLVLGADAADLLYALLVLLGVAPFIMRPAVQIVLSIGGGIVLARLALKNLGAVKLSDSSVAPSRLANGSRASAFREGFLVALMSPLTIFFWMSVFGGYYVAATSRGSRTPPAALLAVLFLGAGVWTSVVVVAIHFGRSTLTARWYRTLVIALSILLLLFAARLFWTGARTLAARFASSTVSALLSSA